MAITSTLRQSLTGLSRRKSLSLAIVAMLGIGIASVTAMFALFDAVLLRGLPYAQPEALVHVWGRPADPSLGGSPDSRWWTSYPDLEDFRREQSRLEDLAGYIDNLFVVRSGDAPPRRLKGGRVSAQLFGLLGVRPQQGRLFTASEDQWGAEPVVILSKEFATELGVAAEDMGDFQLRLNEVSHRVIGIMPPTFDLPNDARFWVPLGQNAGQDNRGQHRLMVIGRLPPGGSRQAAEDELATIAARLADRYPDANANRSLWLEPLHESIAGPYRGVMSLLLAACVLLMLVVAVNVAALLMVQAIRRRREVAIRRSLGANRRRLIGQFLAEAMLLGVAGTGVGLALAWAALQSAPLWLPVELPLPRDLHLNPLVLGAALGTGLLATVGFGLVPALRVMKSTSAADLKPGSRAAHSGSRLGVGGLMLAIQMALAFALVAGAMMLLRTAHDLLNEPLGFEADGRLVFRIFLPATHYHPIEQPLKVNAYYRELMDGVRALPGVRSAAVAQVHPLEPNWSSSYWIEGREPAPEVPPEARFRPVGPDYFRAAGIPLLAGREISPADDFDAPGVVVINQSFARLHFGDVDPVGQYLTKNGWWEARSSTRWQIIGVAGDVLFDGPGKPAAPALYFSQAQWPLEDRHLLIHANGDPAALVRPVQELIWSIDPAVPADAITFLDRARADGLRNRLLATWLVGTFAVIVVLIAVSGLYAVLNFAVGVERRQIGIRLAVGANPASILWRYLRRGLLLALVGGAAGAGLYLGVRRFAETVSVELQAPGTAVLLASGALFLLVALLGALIPARRAADLSPMEVLREE